MPLVGLGTSQPPSSCRESSASFPVPGLRAGRRGRNAALALHCLPGCRRTRQTWRRAKQYLLSKSWHGPGDRLRSHALRTPRRSVASFDWARRKRSFSRIMSVSARPLRIAPVAVSRPPAAPSIARPRLLASGSARKISAGPSVFAQRTADVGGGLDNGPAAAARARDDQWPGGCLQGHGDFIGECAFIFRQVRHCRGMRDPAWMPPQNQGGPALRERHERFSRPHRPTWFRRCGDVEHPFFELCDLLDGGVVPGGIFTRSIIRAALRCTSWRRFKASTGAVLVTSSPSTKTASASIVSLSEGVRAAPSRNTASSRLSRSKSLSETPA